LAFLRNLFGQPNTKPDFTGLQIQTSTSTLPIAIIWGMTKLSGNVMWYNNFQTTNPGGKGGFFSTPSSSYSYTADLMIALCEGPLQGINQIWKNQDIYTLAQLNLTLFEGTTPQATWGYLSSVYPNEALGYQGTAYVCAASYQLGDDASIGNHNFEVVSADFYGTSPNGIDADPAAVIYDFLTNPQYGAGFAASSINTSTLYGGGAGSTDASLQAYCAALGIGFSPALTGQETASSILTRWLQICNCAAVWSGTQLKFIPYGDLPIGTTDLTQTISLSVPQPSTDPNDVINPAVTVCATALWVSDGGVKYAFTGAALTYNPGGTANGAGTYGLASGWQGQQYVFSPADEGNVVKITFTRHVPRGYAPDLTPVYSLTDTDFIATKPGEEPIKVSRLDPFTLPTIQRIECCSRANQYGSTPVEARDQSQIELFGPRVGSTVTAHEICDDILVAPIVAQTILQRGLYVRAHFKFGLGWEFGLLEPMDIVEITDANLGLIAYPVRITEIEEDENGVLAVTAEELTVGISTPVQYPSATPTGWQSNQGVAAAAVNTPLIYEPPPALTGNVAEIWLGASGGISGAADPYWGGAYIYASLDDESYGPPIGQVTQPLRQGVLTGNLASASGWDTANTLAVSVAESGGVLDSGTPASAQAGAPMALVDQELVAYATATPYATYKYNLTGLERGLYGTSPAAHSAGASFARLDGAVFKYSVPANLIGKTLYFKFQSYNIFGKGLQALSSCATYTHALTGTGVPQPADITGFGAALDMNAAGNYTLIASWNPDPNSTSYQVQWSVDGVTWGACWAGSANSFSLPGWSYISALYLRIEGVNGAFSSPTWEEITVTPGPQQTVDVGNAGLYVALNDLQADLADIVAQSIALAQDNINIATITHVASLNGAITAAQSQIGSIGASTATAITYALSQIGSLGVSTAAAITTLTANVGNVNAALNSLEIAQSTSSTAIAADLTALSTSVGSVSAALSTFILAQSTESSAVAISLTALSTSVGSVSAGLSTFMTAQSTWSTAVAGEVTSLSTSVGSVSAGLSTFMVAQSTASTAVAASLSSLSTSVGSVSAGLSAFETAQSTASTAVAASLSSLSTSVGSVTAGLSTFMVAQSTWSTAVAVSLSSLSTGVGSVSAGLSAFETAQSTASTAVAIAISSLSTAVGANSSSISTTEAAVATLNGITAASYGVKLDVNGYITGFELLSGGTGVSAFTVSADEFFFITPGYSSTRVMSISTINGVPGLAFNGNFIADGTLNAYSLVTSTAVITNTLQLGNSPYNVVTIPTSWFSAAAINAPVGGGTTTLKDLYFTLDQPGFVHVVFSAVQTYSSGFYTSNIQMYVDGTLATQANYGFEEISVVLAYSPGVLAAGSHHVTIDWYGSSSSDGVAEMSLLILGVKR